jgi:hypothetical protein
MLWARACGDVIGTGIMPMDVVVPANSKNATLAPGDSIMGPPVGTRKPKAVGNVRSVVKQPLSLASSGGGGTATDTSAACALVLFRLSHFNEGDTIAMQVSGDGASVSPRRPSWWPLEELEIPEPLPAQ